MLDEVAGMADDNEGRRTTSPVPGRESDLQDDRRRFCDTALAEHVLEVLIEKKPGEGDLAECAVFWQLEDADDGTLERLQRGWRRG